MVKIEMTLKKPPASQMPDAGWDRTRQNVELALQGPVGKLVRDSFEKRVKNWDTKVTFKSKFKAGPRRSRLDTGPYGRNRRIWEWVSGGTYPHPIHPVKAKKLTVQDYSPKTKPGGVYGGPGSRTGSVSCLSFVHNLGIKARNFEDDIGREVEDEVLTILSKAIIKGFTP